MEFQFPKLKWSEDTFDRLLKAISQAVSQYDFDSNSRDGTWIATPGDKVVEHNLGVVPRQILIYSAADAEGGSMAEDTWTAVDENSITITGSGSFCRVLLNK